MKLTPGIGYYVSGMAILGGFMLWMFEFASPMAELICGLVGFLIIGGVFSAYMSARNRP